MVEPGGIQRAGPVDLDFAVVAAGTHRAARNERRHRLVRARVVHLAPTSTVDRGRPERARSRPRAWSRPGSGHTTSTCGGSGSPRPTAEDFNRVGTELWDMQAELLGNLGTVAKVVRPIIINNRIRNVPEVLPFSFASFLWVQAAPAQWYIEE